MKKYSFLFILMLLPTALNVVEVQGQELTISDKQNSGCLSRTRGYEDEEEQIPTIILTKEASILSVEAQNIISNCATSDFVVKSSMSEGNDGSPCTLSVNVAPVTGELLADCLCPFNVSFTIRDLEPNSFYMDCLWYKGLVELKDGEPLVLEDAYDNITIDGMNFTLRKAFHQAMLTKSEWVGEVRIPSELNYEGQTYSVTSIYNGAFSDNTALTKVFIPRTIKNMDFSEKGGIHRNPFARCSALESIEVEEGNPVLCAVDGVLFNKEKTRLYSYPAADSRTSYTVPKGVTWIDDAAFASNHHLVSISLPDDVTSLGNSAFYDCINLEEVSLPSGLKTLAGYLFWNCQHLKSITIPEGVTHLGGNLFNGCTSLTSATMPESVTTTDYSVFENCKSLKHVILSPNLDLINHNMFVNCSSLEEIQIPKSITSVMTNAFKGCKALKTLDLPESVYRLGDYVFSECKLESLYIRGIIDFRWTDHYWLFDGMGTEAKVFVQPSQVDKFKEIYKGSVYPLPEQTNTPDTSKYFPIGMTWEEVNVNPSMEFEYENAHIYEIGTDTIIGGVTYKKVLKDNVFSGLCVRESGDKVWLLTKEYPTEILLYNFDWDSNQDVVTEYLKGHEVIGFIGQNMEAYEVRQETTPVGDCQTVIIDGKIYQYYMKRLSGTIIRGIGKVAELNRYPCLLSYREPAVILPGLDYHKVHWIKRNGVEIFRSESAKEWTEEIMDNYRPFVEEGKVWKVGTISGNPVQIVDYYYFDGDTIIDGKTCKQMMCQRFVSPDYSNEYWTPKNSLTKVGAWYEEDQKVYFYNLQKEKDYWRIKYDFSLNANDTLQFLNWDGYPPFIIGPKQTGGIEGFKGVYRDIMMCTDEGQNIHSTFWLEGVGDINGPTRYPIDPILDDPVPEFLMSCVVGDEVIYLNDRYEDAATPAGARKNRFDFTHTHKLKPKSRVRSEEEPSLYGEYNDQQLDINLGPLDDTYQVCITDGSGKAIYEKVINAGNIVGLDIDISAYDKGRYTVIVENSRESFTGEFETLTNGIEENVKIKKLENLSIYNLQGQRLNSLQKGLNIVNGRKIYVKN
ncbi:MAG: leucine-rich repeat domain-containing protein [Prevotella sp.]|nr:leucine-rich repeat domain-containing protein [Prevotella sp.]